MADVLQWSSKPFWKRDWGSSPSPNGKQFPVAIKLHFEYLNNITEYEICVNGLLLAINMKVKEFDVYDDSALIIYQVNIEWQTEDPKLIPY